MDKLKEYLRVVVAGLVSNQDAVEVTGKEDEKGVLLVVRVAPEDTGKVIGKQGSIAEALRVIVRSAGYIENIRVSMKVDAPGSNFELKEGN